MAGLLRIIGLIVLVVVFSASQSSGGFAKSAKNISYKSKHAPGTIIISNSKRRLYYVLEDNRAMAYDVAVGRPSEQWTGTQLVTNKRKNPTWTPTPDMRKKNPRLPKFVPAGPKNPLGIRAIYLGWTTLRIHGTNSPNSIGRAASSGCIRMFNADVTDLYERVHIGAPVVVVR